MGVQRTRSSECVTPLAVTSTTRWPELPDVPTMAESGISEVPTDISYSGLQENRNRTFMMPLPNKTMFTTMLAVYTSADVCGTALAHLIKPQLDPIERNTL